MRVVMILLKTFLEAKVVSHETAAQHALHPLHHLPELQAAVPKENRLCKTLWKAKSRIR